MTESTSTTAATVSNYNYFRDYDPSIGRYVESDPVGLDGGNNTYSYVDSNSLVFADPTGEYVALGLWAYRLYRAYQATRLGQGLAGAAAAAGGAAVSSDTSQTGTSQADSPEKLSDRQTYHRRCDEQPPGGLSQCDLIRWKIRRAKDCIRMRQDYITKWNDTFPGHADQIAQRQQELSNLEKQLGSCCDK